MIPIHIENKELWDDENNQFIYLGPSEGALDLMLEHSLHSVYKWESKYHKSYTNTEEKTIDETLDYISMMVIGEYEDRFDKDVFRALEPEEINRIHDYINDPMTATTFSEDKEKNKKSKGKTLNDEIVTAEILYYYMTAMNIPFECQYWHLNQLITLIRVCSIKNTPDDKDKKKKLSSSDMVIRRAKMEAARAKYSKH